MLTAAMITGINKVINHGGRELHIQGEDLGIETGVFEIRVYEGGTVLWMKRFPYTDLLEQNLEKKELETQLRTKMDKLARTAEKAIEQGKIS